MMGSMACVGEATLVELVRGGLAEDEGRAVEAHLAACDECRRVVSELARSSLAGDTRAPAAPVLWAEGAVVAGRFRLERRIGEGGMGEVWAGVHVVTRRPVALKC